MLTSFAYSATQYCDALRGPFVVYDPDDPWASEYDVDDGEIERLFLENTHLHSNATETTVVTLADWYHAKAKTLTFPYVMLEEWQLE